MSFLGGLAGGFLGSAAGPISQTSPAVRPLLAALLIAAVAAAPAGSAAPALYVVVVALGSVIATGLPGRRLAAVLRLAVLLYLPLVGILLLPVLLETLRRALQVLRSGGGMESLVPPADPLVATAAFIGLKGVAGLVVALSLLASLRAPQMHAALGRLPLPVGVRMLLLQIVHQTGNVFGETQRMRQALVVRGGGAPGHRQALALATGLPAAWLARVAERADRVASAMEVRGYHLHPLPHVLLPGGWNRADRVAMAAAAAALLASLALHLA